ncbi:MAG: hypothetical protein KDJ88_14915 [Bauldia sp.]|nr:hypothetical protein [Bauldia sp.]
MPQPQSDPSIEALARLSGCPAERIATYRDLGLVDPDHPENGTVTLVRLVESLESLGLEPATLSSAVGAGHLNLDFARDMLARPVAMVDRTYRQLIAELGLEPALAQAIFVAVGLPTFDLDRPARNDDAAFLTLLARVTASGLSRKSLFRALRVFGHSLRRIAEAQRDLYREEVEQPMLAAGAPLGRLLAEGAAQRRQLQEIGFQAIGILFARILEDLVFENIAFRLQNGLSDLGFASRDDASHTVVVGFADMSGYTDFVREFGDREGAERTGQFEELVQTILEGRAGRIIKSLGDGLLLHFSGTRDALNGSAEIIRQARSSSLLPVHVGLAAGPVLFRDGDIFGTTVNRAARISAQAAPGTVLIDEAVKSLATDIDIDWNAVDFPPLKGLPDTRGYAWTP